MTEAEGMAMACQTYVSEMAAFGTWVGVVFGSLVTSLVWALTLLYRSRKS